MLRPKSYKLVQQYKILNQRISDNAMSENDSQYIFLFNDN